MRYRYNPYCSCGRCRCHGYMGPAVLITLGVLFLLDQIGHSHWMEFGSTWPAILIVIGLVLFQQHNASPAGHVPREYGAMPQASVPPGTPTYPGQPGAAVYPGQPQAPVAPPPPVPPAGTLGPGGAITRSDDQEVHNV